MLTREEALKLYKNRNFSALYGDHYEGTQEWVRVSRAMSRYAILADFIANIAKPRTVLDVGCGKGDLVSELRKRGIKAWGFDASNYIFNDCVSPEWWNDIFQKNGFVPIKTEPEITGLSIYAYERKKSDYNSSSF